MNKLQKFFQDRSVNELFLGTSASGKPFLWKPTPGRFIIRAVDDQGRSDAREIRAVTVE